MARAAKLLDDSKPSDPELHQDASDAIREIDDAVQHAESSFSAEKLNSAGMGVVTADSMAPALAVEPVGSPSAVGEGFAATRRFDRDETHEQRIQRLIKRAQQQKKRGRDELVKSYDGVMSVKKTMRLFDVNIASSGERFLGTIDLTLNTVVRRGTLAIGTAASEEIMDRFTEMVAEYLRSAREALTSAELVMKNEKGDTIGEWLEPDYTSVAFECEVQAKHRLTLQLIEALTAWDKAIHSMNVLEWNGKVDAAQVAQIREQERRGLSALYGFSVKTLQGMKRKTEVPASSGIASHFAQSGAAANAERVVA
jgi:hypothetical protein